MPLLEEMPVSLEAEVGPVFAEDIVFTGPSVVDILLVTANETQSTSNLISRSPETVIVQELLSKGQGYEMAMLHGLAGKKIPQQL